MTQEHSSKPAIAFLGTGLMGLPMATRLLDAGFPLHVWNRTAAKAAPLAQLGAHLHASAAEAAHHAAITISMLENGDVVRKVLEDQGVAAAMPADSLFIDMASIQPEQARAHAQLLQARGIRTLDAPVSGGTVGAEAGTLAIMVGGDAADFAAASAIFAALGRATHVGGHGTGQLTKLINQMIVGVTIGAVAEGLLLARKGGADPAKVREAISGGFADSRILLLHGERMVAQDFAPRARMTVQLKDLRNALATSAQLDFEPPITRLLHALFEDACREGFADLDHSALYLALAQRNGMKQP
ncbi:2-hydroxy-3-oxopropionate reductase [Lampropedia cohaerens]|uniref:2-hydroxy-3-oxopropionate reductase n=1 Tax=Lampropedia cohaerens TaxID=1610491 RepID=A0A0U1Q2D9_9BURK|nr:NAD(P)-dependent oxidoreductase [Lampropedia cohaerens]KKW68929.1 2-hydroxy-3-oxopropionate reductase [Lampropedia cohaerens]